MTYEGFYNPVFTPGIGSRPRLQSMHPFRQLVAAGSHVNPAWSGAGGGGGGGYGSGHSGYGVEPPEYDYHSGPQAHVPSGGGYSYHATADTGYGVPPPAPQPPQKGGKKGGGKKGFGSSSAMSALTLLSFFFFVNLLQGCIKDHMDAMNPTVMVMTTNVRRNRYNKMGEMNSREQSSTVTSASTISGTGANNVRKPADMMAAASSHAATVMEAANSVLNLQSPYSDGVAASVTSSLDNQQQLTYQGGAVQQAPPPPGHAPQIYQGNRPEYNGQNQRPYYDGHGQQPDSYEANKKPQYQTPYMPMPQQPYPQQAVSYANHSHSHYNQAPSIFSSPQQEHVTHFHYPPNEQHYAPHSPNDYHPYNVMPQYPDRQQPASPFSTPHKPFYDNQHSASPSAAASPPPSPVTLSPQIYTGLRDRPPQYSMSNMDNDKYSHKHEMPASQQNQHGPVPWSSHSTTSVVSGPFRRASIVALSSSPKWISGNVNDQNNFDSKEVESDSTPHNSRYGESDYVKRS